MEEIIKQPTFHYAAAHHDPRDLYVDVELSDDQYIIEEKAIIDRLMKKFYDEFMKEYKKIRKHQR